MQNIENFWNSEFLEIKIALRWTARNSEIQKFIWLSEFLGVDFQEFKPRSSEMHLNYWISELLEIQIALRRTARNSENQKFRNVRNCEFPEIQNILNYPIAEFLEIQRLVNSAIYEFLHFWQSSGERFQFLEIKNYQCLNVQEFKPLPAGLPEVQISRWTWCLGCFW